MSKKKEYKEYVEPTEVFEESVAESTEVVEETEVIVETPNVEEPKMAFGSVANCSAVNVRKKPNLNAKVLTTLKRGAVVSIDLEKSTDKFYKVTIAGSTTEGFCMRDYILVQE